MNLSMVMYFLLPFRKCPFQSELIRLKRDMRPLHVLYVSQLDLLNIKILLGQLVKLEWVLRVRFINLSVLGVLISSF